MGADDEELLAAGADDQAAEAGDEEGVFVSVDVVTGASVVAGASVVVGASAVQEELGVHAGAAGAVVEVAEVAAGSTDCDCDCPCPQPQCPQPPVEPAAQPPVWVIVTV